MLFYLGPHVVLEAQCIRCFGYSSTHYHAVYYKSQGYQPTQTSGTTCIGCLHPLVSATNDPPPGAHHCSRDILEPLRRPGKNLDILQEKGSQMLGGPQNFPLRMQCGQRVPTPSLVVHLATSW